MYSTLWISKQV